MEFKRYEDINEFIKDNMEVDFIKTLKEYFPSYQCRIYCKTIL